MIEIATQYIDGCYVPVSLKDQGQAHANHKENQIVRAKLSVVRHPRSVKQLQLYWVSCALVAENEPHPALCDKDAVDFHTRVALEFYDHDKIMVKGNQTVLALKSIAFDNLNQPGMNDYMGKAMDLHAGWLGVSPGELTLEAGRRIARYSR